MDEAERWEKARQAVMRLRELLDIMRANLEHGETVYAALFDHLSDEEKRLPEKQRQGLAGELVLEDRKPLEGAALDMRWHAHELDRAFEELYDIVVSIETS